MLKKVLFCGLSMMASTAVCATDQATLSAELISAVTSNTGNYIGDYNIEKITPLVEALQAKPTSETAYQALLAASTDGSYINKPIDGHFYQITSAFPYFVGDYLKETYYTYDYHPAQNRQRVYFHAEEAEENPVPTFWKFDRQDSKNGTDADDYYMIRAVNSGLVMRQTGNNTVVDTRPDTDGQAGVYSIMKNDYVVYDHAVALLSHRNNNARSATYYLGTYTVNQGKGDSPTDHNGEETDVRDGSKVLTPTDEYVQGANNWLISEVKTFPVYFYSYEESFDTYSLDQATYFYTTVCFPFAVRIPAEITAYSAGIGLVNGGNKLWLTQIEVLPEHRTDIIPANTPAILRAEEQGVYDLTILYDDNHSVVNFGLNGTITPQALDTDQSVYVIDDDYDSYATLKTEGIDYSYDTDQDYKETGKAPKSLYNSDSTYILAANTAYVEAGSLTDDVIDIADLNLPTTGVEAVTINRQETSADIIYYNLQGQRVDNPTSGLYILSNGKKVILK